MGGGRMGVLLIFLLLRAHAVDEIDSFLQSVSSDLGHLQPTRLGLTSESTRRWVPRLNIPDRPPLSASALLATMKAPIRQGRLRGANREDPSKLLALPRGMSVKEDSLERSPLQPFTLKPMKFNFSESFMLLGKEGSTLYVLHRNIRPCFLNPVTIAPSLFPDLESTWEPLIDIDGVMQVKKRVLRIHECLSRALSERLDHCQGQGSICIQDADFALRLMERYFRNASSFGSAEFLRYAGAVNKGVPAFFAVAALFGLASFVALAVFVASVVVGFWYDRKDFLVLLGMLFVGLVLRFTTWLISAIGYINVAAVNVNYHGVAQVSWSDLKIMERCGSVAFLLTAGFFAWMLLSPMLSTFFPEKKRLKVLIGGIVGMSVLMAAVYGILMAVLQANAYGSTFVVDATDPLHAGLTMVLAGFVTGMWLTLWRMLQDKGNDPSSVEMRRNSLVIFVCSAIVSIVMIPYFVLSVIWLTSDQSLLIPMYACGIVANLLVAFGIIMYVGIPMWKEISSRKRRQTANASLSGYVALDEEGSRESVLIPQQYRNV